MSPGDNDPLDSCPTKTAPFLDKAHAALRAADLLLDKGLNDSAVNRAYFAVFHAAKAALIAAGVSDSHFDWTHEKVQGQFPLLVHRRKLYVAALLPTLSHCRSLRALADYGVEVVSYKEARSATKVAALFVSAVDSRITQ